MGWKIDLRTALADDPDPLTAPPAWTNGVLARIPGEAVVHAGGGRLDGAWHSQDGVECLIVVEGELVVEFDAGPLRAAPGEAIVIAPGERHRASVPDGCLLISVEPVGMRRDDVH
ncbi:MAG TPA: cupin domain-containing protein [Gaiellaceae bacterium]|jgi:quercetin dioxygenase-like cupin family protein